MSKPLWEATVIEGLDNVALLEVLKAFEGETAFITGGPVEPRIVTRLATQ